MFQFLTNIWINLTIENVELVNLLMTLATIIEAFLFMNLFLTISNIKASIFQKIIYVFSMSLTALISSSIIPSPFNIAVNYICIFCFIISIFRLNVIKSFISLIVPTFILALLNILLQNPYLTLLDISPDEFLSIPIYRFIYLTILYTLLFSINLLLNKFINSKFSLDVLDSLDKKTIKILYANIALGFLALCIQLVITAFYIDIVPIIITVLSVILLISFFVLSVYSFTRILKLANTKRNLQNAEEYNRSLEILYDKVKGFKHDFDNIVSTLDGFIENNDMIGLKKYFSEIKKDCKITNNLSVLNPTIINNPGIYGLLNNKYFKATNSGVTLDIEYFLDLNSVESNLYMLSRILGILIDNAIEEAEKCEEKIVRISFIREDRNNRAVITVENTYSNKDINTEEIFKKGISNKEHHSGIGLWEVRNYVKESKNLDLFTSKNDKFFKQEFYIYDLQNK